MLPRVAIPTKFRGLDRRTGQHLVLSVSLCIALCRVFALGFDLVGMASERATRHECGRSPCAVHLSDALRTIRHLFQETICVAFVYGAIDAISQYSVVLRGKQYEGRAGILSVVVVVCLYLFSDESIGLWPWDVRFDMVLW